MLEDVKKSIREKFPTLNIVVENDIVFIRGILLLPEDIDEFIIEIELLEDYPDSIPIVRETGGRIPHGKRHVFTHGDCCLFVREETWKHYPKGTTIIDFLNKIVVPYFLAQACFEITGKWLWGERSHDIYGILESYKEELKTNDIKLILRFIEYLAKSTLKKYRICYCGSKKKLQNCHYQTLKNYREKISQRIAKDSLILWFTELKRLENVKITEQQMIK
ncbi:MAG: hypothetical protein M3367_10670 [Acidobacteriota bacterium]|nr:hypothetical protein [Acidobacteriota bacterium]